MGIVAGFLGLSLALGGPLYADDGKDQRHHKKQDDEGKPAGRPGPPGPDHPDRQESEEAARAPGRVRPGRTHHSISGGTSGHPLYGATQTTNAPTVSAKSDDAACHPIAVVPKAMTPVSSEIG